MLLRALEVKKSKNLSSCCHGNYWDPHLSNSFKKSRGADECIVLIFCFFRMVTYKLLVMPLRFTRRPVILLERGCMSILPPCLFILLAVSGLQHPWTLKRVGKNNL